MFFSFRTKNYAYMLNELFFLFSEVFFVIRVICILRPFRRLGYWKIFSKKSPTVLSLCLSPFVVVAALRLIRHVLFTLLWPRQRNVYELFLKHAYHTHEHIHICSISCANRNFVVRCVPFFWGLSPKISHTWNSDFHCCLFDKSNTLPVSLARSSYLFCFKLGSWRASQRCWVWTWTAQRL